MSKSLIAISAKGLMKKFGEGDASVIAMNNLDLDLAAGEMTLVKGPSGSGKSTLIAILGGLQKPDAGQVFSFEQELWSLSSNDLDKFRRQHVGFVFQSMGLFASLTARQQILFPMQHMGFSKKEALIKADALLEEVGLSHRKNVRPAQMSGGENQRVAIARMFSKEPKIIFADEPTSALDSKNGRIVAELLHRSAKSHNAMVLCVTHDDRLSSHADRILTLEDGIISSDYRPQPLKN
ncbi:ABC transporter ATP-binding protein [Pseudocolwellia agarivorans]|uniref:ABC transporter ATP-binding protein n=1 Tax=Pseudocolwellia agarivorans TaxID=1911682 RepID=UPI000986CFA4|nr:ABC transporter ATP-binding protein [Pseudocolwellia agarivorans]